ncbi:hypothetical protein ACFXPR_07545 [Nocardia tengchongensis]|uniref:hypothetical protein n=1 Tax=Nocardia tengchongensis TaxID=2055889 RepID=UPI0036AF2828
MISSEDTPTPTETRFTIATFSRVAGSADNALSAARITGRLRKIGVPARLIVRGAPQLMFERVRLMLSASAISSVEVRPYTTEFDEIATDIVNADAVIIPVRAAEFDESALAATVSGVPLLVPDISAIGLYLADRYPAELVGPMLIPQQAGAAVQLDQWVQRLHEMYADLPRARHRSAELQRIVHEHNRTPEAVETSLAMIDRATRAVRNLPSPRI